MLYIAWACLHNVFQILLLSMKDMNIAKLTSVDLPLTSVEYAHLPSSIFWYFFADSVAVNEGHEHCQADVSRSSLVQRCHVGSLPGHRDACH